METSLSVCSDCLESNAEMYWLVQSLQDNCLVSVHLLSIAFNTVTSNFPFTISSEWCWEFFLHICTITVRLLSSELTDGNQFLVARTKHPLCELKLILGGFSETCLTLRTPPKQCPKEKREKMSNSLVCIKILGTLFVAKIGDFKVFDFSAALTYVCC